MIHGGDHRYKRFPIREREHGHLRPAQEFLHHNAASACAEFPRTHDGIDRRLRLAVVLRNDHALAECKPIRLDDGRITCFFQVGKRSLRFGEHLISRRGNAITLHQGFGEHLATFDLRCLCVRPKAGDAKRVKPVHCAHRKRVIRRDNGKIHRLFLCKCRDFVNFLCADGYAYRIRRNAAVSRQRIDRFYLRILFDCFYDSVLAPAAADDHDFHAVCASFNGGTAEGP